MPFWKMYNLIYFNMIGTFVVLLGVTLLLSMSVGAAEGNTLTTQQELQPIKIIPGDGMNLAIEEYVNSHYTVVKLTSPAHNWFAGTFTNLPTDKPVTIGLSMDGNDTTGNKADVSKWRGLTPVMTYADPNRYETYEWFAKDGQGRWVSGSPFKRGDAKYAGSGKVPEQSVIPKEIAELFLSVDGKYWQAWREVDFAEAVTGLNIFRVKQKFTLPTATVAMRIPCPNLVVDEILSKIRESHLNGIIIDSVGKSSGNRELNAVVLRDPSEIGQQQLIQRPTMLFYAEDGNEHDANWINLGILTSLLSDDDSVKEVRKKINIIIIPTYDPDGIADSTYAHITNTYRVKSINQQLPVETCAYAKYLTTFIAQGNRLDIVCALHNVECNESTNLLCPIIDARRNDMMVSMNDYILNSISGISISHQIWMKGFLDYRLNGWCSINFGSIVSIYEANSRFPANRLSLNQLQNVGQSLVKAFTCYTNTMDYARMAQEIDKAQIYHRAKRQQYWAAQKDANRDHTPYELITLGF